MKIQIGNNKTNIQKSSDPNTTQIQIGFPPLWLTAIIIGAGTYFYFS